LNFSKRNDTIYIDIEGDYKNWTDLIDIMLSCENILTSSLHGVILSDSYNIPNLWFKATDGITGDGFKFRDYYQSVKKNVIQPLDLNLYISIDQIDKRLEKWLPINFNYTDFLRSFPYQNLLRKNIFNN
jgi:pyruvyltransferase